MCKNQLLFIFMPICLTVMFAGVCSGFYPAHIKNLYEFACVQCSNYGAAWNPLTETQDPGIFPMKEFSSLENEMFCGNHR